MTRLSYAAITPVRNEVENVRRLADSLEAQLFRPVSWVIVDNGSSDETQSLAAELAETRNWIHVLSVPGDARARPGAPIVRAFHAGLETLGTLPDVIVKLDADVSCDPDYFERVLEAFEDDERLGITSGTCLEEENGVWRAQAVTGDHVRGATRAYRRECLQAVLPLEERVGWDGIDELKAHVLGWRTRMLTDVSFRHHRKVGQRDGGAAARWRALGSASYFMGYRFSYLLMRAVHRSRRDPAALAMIGSYLGAWLRREPRYSDVSVVAHLREQQSLRRLRLRAREALGRAGSQQSS